MSPIAAGVLKITLPLPPNRGNSRWHWRTEHKKKLDYLTRSWLVTRRYRHLKPPIPLHRVRLRATLYVWNRMDMDNLMARMKWPLDWLVRNGWLVDDGPDVIEWAGLPTQEIDRKNQRIEIELERIGVVDDDRGDTPPEAA